MVDATLPVLKSGYMEKLSTGIMKQWHKRYWILTAKYIKVMVCLTACADITIDRFRFSITFPKKTQRLKSHAPSFH